MLKQGLTRALALAVAIALGAAQPIWAQAQNGQVTGTVVSAETLQPLGAVQVYLDGTGRASITRSDGTYTITNIPAGTYTVVAQSIGYQQARQAGVTVGAGSVTVNFQMAQNVLQLQGVVATGLVDPVEGARSPITVGQVTREQMPVAAGSADPVTQLQGKVAGVTISRAGGQPGQDAQVRLRTPTSAVGSNRPLYVVDGVILGTDPVDIESSDIEAIEVVKGAAAASLYGSRAAAGVISITTNRGRGIAAGETRFSFNSEYGQSEPADFLPMPSHHQFATNDQGQLVNAQGQPVPWSGRYEPPVAFMDKNFPAEFGVYNNLKEIYRPGGFNSQTFSISSNSENTNFASSVSRLFEQGAIEGNQGYERTGFRVNLDHRFNETMQLGISGYHSRSFRDDIGSGAPGGNGGLLGDFFLIPPYIDLSQKDPQSGEFNRFYGQDYGVVVEHPVWRQTNRDFERSAARTLGNTTLRWTPFYWLNAVADVSFDREDAVQETYVPKGAQDPSGEAYDGRLAFDHNVIDTFNGSLQAAIRRDFGALNSRTTIRGIMERVNEDQDRSEGQDFRVYDVKRIDAAAIKLATSETEEIRSTGYLIDQAFDYDGKYILSVLGRRDGSSLFGPDNRWHNYYRVAGAWRLTEEPWFDVAGLDEFKLKASRGTAGGRPSYSNQYETWSVTASGITKGALGNRELRPEHTTENEFGIEAILFGKVGIELVHARQKTEHQLYQLLLPGAVGYTSQWINAGTLQGNSTELALESRILDRGDLSWTTNVVADRSTAKISEWPVPCRILDQITYACQNTNPRDIYGYHYYRSLDELPAHLQPYSNQFQVNDDGFVVWVGEGNSYTDGRTKSLWGTSGNVAGQTLAWGYPVLDRTEEGAAVFQKIGQGDPDLQLGWMNTVTWKGFTAHAQLHAQIGGQVYNMTKHYTIFDKVHPVLDQAGKAEENKKPIAYYVNGMYNGSIISDAFVEDAGYVKLRTLSLTYRFTPDALQRVGLAGMGVRGVELGVVGRNLFTSTNYSGFDPEVVSNARLTPLDNYAYPNMRNYTVSVGVNF